MSSSVLSYFELQTAIAICNLSWKITSATIQYSSKEDPERNLNTSFLIFKKFLIIVRANCGGKSNQPFLHSLRSHSHIINLVSQIVSISRENEISTETNSFVRVVSSVNHQIVYVGKYVSNLLLCRKIENFRKKRPKSYEIFMI